MFLVYTSEGGNKPTLTTVDADSVDAGEWNNGFIYFMKKDVGTVAMFSIGSVIKIIKQ